jgi:hypothetical protein
MINDATMSPALPDPDDDFRPTSEYSWVMSAAKKVSAEHRKIQAAQYAGLTVAQKEEIALERERDEQARRNAWAKEQTAMQIGWAKWRRWRETNPAQADRYRAEHTDESGDKNWMIAFGSVRSVDGVRIPGKAKSQRTEVAQ